MTVRPSLPPAYAATRAELQRVATHVVARARAAHGGRFGLRATPSGIATPPFGPDATVVRLTGTVLVTEVQTSAGRTTTTFPLEGRTLEDAARFVGVDLSVEFSPGDEAPALGQPGATLELDEPSAHVVLGWYGLGARVLDALLPSLTSPTAAQVWPEHFDLGLSATTASGGVDLGASPGDGTVPEPYLYAAPWEADRPGEPSFWNVPFGAVQTRSDLAGSGDPEAAGSAFLARALCLLAES